MQIDLTVCDPSGRDVDAAIRTPENARFGDLIAHVLQAVHAPPATVAIGVDDDAIPGSEGLTNGSTLVLRHADGTARVGGSQRRDSAEELNGLAVHVVGGRGAGRSVLLEAGGVLVGRGARCGLVLDDDSVSRVHAVVRAADHCATVRDAGSTNGTFVDGRQLLPDTPTEVGPDDVIRVGDTLLAVRAVVDQRRDPTQRFDTRVVRRPRTRVDPRPVTIELSDPPSHPRAGPVQWLAAALPALAGAALAWVTHSIVFLLFALLSPVVLVATALGDRFHDRRDRRRGDAAYSLRRAGEDEQISSVLRAEAVRRRAEHCDPVGLARTVTACTERLWERRPTDADALCVRLGSADLPSQARVRRGRSEHCAGVVVAVPVVADLRAGSLGLTGPPEVVAALARWVITQLAVSHPPSGLALVFLLGDATRSKRWSWARWLPHLAGRVGTVAVEWTDLVDDLVGARPADNTPGPDARRPDLWTVVVVDAAFADDETVLADRLARRASPGVTALLLDSVGGTRPPACGRLFDLGDPRTAGGSHWEAAGEHHVTPDGVDEDWADTVARALAALTDATPSASSLPRRCHLLDLLGLDHTEPAEIVRRWSGSGGRAAVTLGIAADGPVEIDLARDGPHFLVAGTTGSGKSELLRSFVLGLALSCPPDEVSFVLIDYKGGAAFTDAEALPHVVGSVTDLDAHLTRRALRSLDAELRRRERLFRSAAAADLDAYRRAGHGPALARLVLMIDEFAALADELPEFLRGLVAVARRGRSLGVHLVLATQRPGSAVTPEIRANTSTRIALRTVEPGESQDVIGVPDASLIPPGVPGRAVRATDAGPVVFQTAGVDGVRRDLVRGPEVELLGPWRRRRPAADATPADGYRAVVDAVVCAARLRGSTPPPAPWLPPLPEVLPLDDLEPSSAQHVPFAVVDLPDHQRHEVLSIDLDRPSSWLLVGGPRSGRTSALLAVGLSGVRSSPPDGLQLHVLDGAGVLRAHLRELPHLATCLGPDELSSTAELLRRLAERDASEGRIVLLADRIDDLLAGGDGAAPSVPDAFAVLRRSGRVTIVLAGSRDLLATRTTAGFEHRLLLRLPDRTDYALAGIAQADVPASQPPGRAVRTSDAAQLQFAYPGDRHAAASVSEYAQRISSRWAGVPAPAALRLRPLPRTVSLSSLPADPTRLRIGVVGEAATTLSVDVFAGPRRHLVGGPSRSGRSTLLLTLLAEAVRVGHPVLVAAPASSPLVGAARTHGVPVLDPATFPAMPTRATLVLVDDCETFAATTAGDALAAWARDNASLSFVVAGRSDDLAAAYGGLAAEVRRSRSGILLRPGPLDGELFDARVPAARGTPAGRGLLIGEPAWLSGIPDIDPTSPLPIQVAIA